jgi:hypothetical protein
MNGDTSDHTVHAGRNIDFKDIATANVGNIEHQPTRQRLWLRVPAPSAEAEAAGQHLDNPKGWPITRTSGAQRAL